MAMALIEWLVLSECSLILHTYGSSFAMEAALVNRRPLVGLWENITIFHYDERLPYCGHMQFLRKTSQEGIDVEWKEGTHDSRTVT